ncbi:melanocortin-2 receptor accessory protein 2A [Hemitrygon akajei]|uniref:melanocortin-2 receptor accessory protein 2A n=1 Tax=Hemitrygon akajei TaxID=2704970 RepID=UPI003BF9C85A
MSLPSLKKNTYNVGRGVAAISSRISFGVGEECEMSEDNPTANKTTVSSNGYVWSYEYYDYEPVSFEGLKAHRYSIVIGFWVGLAVFVLFMFFVLMLLTKTGAPHQELSVQAATCSPRKSRRLGVRAVESDCGSEEGEQSDGRQQWMENIFEMGSNFKTQRCKGTWESSRGALRKSNAIRNLDLMTKQQRMNSFAINYVTCKTDKAFCHPAREESRSLFHFYENEVGHLERQLMTKASDPGSCDLLPQGDGRSKSMNDAADCLGRFDIPNCVTLDQSSSLT